VTLRRSASKPRRWKWDHASLQASHRELAQAKSDVDRELAELKAAIAKAQAHKREAFGFGDLGEPL